MDAEKELFNKAILSFSRKRIATIMLIFVMQTINTDGRKIADHKNPGNCVF